MTKCEIIATCLLNKGTGFKTIQEAITYVREFFNKEFPEYAFRKWNTDIQGSVAQIIIKRADKASRINVERFILDLWE